jgi:peptide/nickel transport system ATP-binding protein
MSLLQAQNVSVEFPTNAGTVRALDGVSLSVESGEIVAVVGESGCGKTTFARAVLGLQPLVSGSISLLGRNVSGASPDSASRVGMVWQDPFASLDPRWPVERSAMEPAVLQGQTVDAKALFEEVGLSDQHLSRYPHQMSGGQRQRVAIARAIALRPPLIICDEPTAALDLSIRAQILNLLKNIQGDLGCSFLYISHDLTTVRYLADRMAVMYLGKIVECGPTEELFQNPRHPYTSALIESAPTLETLGKIPGAPIGELPNPFEKLGGCHFASRCPHVQDQCRTVFPKETTEGSWNYACNFPLIPTQTGR